MPVRVTEEKKKKREKKKYKPLLREKRCCRSLSRGLHPHRGVRETCLYVVPGASAVDRALSFRSVLSSLVWPFVPRSPTVRRSAATPSRVPWLVGRLYCLPTELAPLPSLFSTTRNAPKKFKKYFLLKVLCAGYRLSRLRHLNPTVPGIPASAGPQLAVFYFFCPSQQLLSDCAPFHIVFYGFFGRQTVHCWVGWCVYCMNWQRVVVDFERFP